ncbi:protein PERCC1-like [Antedon mediterranea]|uniref:protein PERCC1-like n=1 Tax=Antedon mediterranea TaxID=105859 RepID=UPI003AF984FF
MASFSLQVGELDETGTLQNLQTTVSNRAFLPESDDEASWEDDFDSEEEEDEDDECQPNICQQLLNYVDIVNKDIQKYFGKSKFLDDVDNKSTKKRKSGPELYYADLLRIAKISDVNGADENGENGGEKTETIHKISWQDKTHNGKVSSSSLGPFGDLFKTNEVRNVSSFTAQEQDGDTLCHRMETCTDNYTLPWKKRKLPTSFFNEPHIGQTINSGDSKHASNTLDFSDLLAHWMVDEDTSPGGSSEFNSSTDDMSFQSL